MRKKRVVSVNLKKLIDNLKEDEGCVLSAYKDSRGFLTIGVGRLIDPALNGGISSEEANILLINDINAVISQLEKNFPWFCSLNEPRKGAIVNMCFNLGLPRFRTFSRFIENMSKGQFQTASTEMISSKWALQVGDRAKRLATIIKSGKW